MAHRGDRFRHLRTPGTADLFEHFGLAEVTDPPVPALADPAPVTAAAACEHCGWYRALPVAGACPLCGAPGREGGREDGHESARGGGAPA